jgi:hypothetical protein
MSAKINKYFENKLYLYLIFTSQWTNIYQVIVLSAVVHQKAVAAYKGKNIKIAAKSANIQIKDEINVHVLYQSNIEE